MGVPEDGGIFVSYRRHESRDFAGRLYDRLADRFGEGQVFIDVDAIEPGVDFAEEISHAVAACKVLLAVIGPAWLTAADEWGRRRLDDPADLVRLEIGAALARDVLVIPILEEGAVMPARQDLPDNLAGLARRNALLIRHESFRYDTGRLVTAVERVLAAAHGAAAVPSAPDIRGVQSARSAVGEMAQKSTGPVRNDLAQAARLLTDAERTARSIINVEQKEELLCDIAEATAATDANRAERIARSLGWPHLKASALSGVAEATAATDPDRATRIFKDAERSARRSSTKPREALGADQRREGGDSHRPRPRRTAPH